MYLHVRSLSLANLQSLLPIPTYKGNYYFDFYSYYFIDCIPKYYDLVLPACLKIQ